MTAQRVAVGTTILNAVFLVFVVVALQFRPLVAGDLATIRTQSLEIVDAQGRTAATLRVYPEDASHPINGAPYPDTVLLRLYAPGGGPDVKLSANRLGGVIVTSGGGQPYAQVGADGVSGWVKLVTQDGKEQLLRP